MISDKDAPTQKHQRLIRTRVSYENSQFTPKTERHVFPKTAAGDMKTSCFVFSETFSNVYNDIIIKKKLKNKQESKNKFEYLQFHHNSATTICC